MSVIVNEMPDNCVECPLSYWDYYFSDLPLRCPLMSDHVEVNKHKRHEDCPLKSVDGLIESIKTYKADVDLAISEDELKINGMKEAYQNCIDVIKDYCGMEDEE